MYDFSTLSPYDFELLVKDLLSRHLAVPLTSFRTGKDKGIDLRYAGGATKSELIVQCKHYRRSSFSDLLRAAKSEIARVRVLSPKRYIFVTSLELSVDEFAKLFGVLTPFCQSPDDVIHCSTLNGYLNRYPEVERKHFKLWMSSTTVLERILHNDVFTQGEIERDEILRQLSLFVPCKAIEDARKILDQEHTCIIAGNPGIGKTTMARVLCADYLANDWEVVRVFNEIKEGLRVLKKDGRERQVLYYDDFLGQISFGDKLAKNEDQQLVQLITSVKQSTNRRLILTTREYIFNQAKQLYEVLSRNDFYPNTCLLKLDDYSDLDKAKILANHLYFYDVPQTHIDSLVDSKACFSIIRHRNYSPRIIEWMTAINDASKIDPAEYPIKFIKALDNPNRLWEHAYLYQIKESSRALLLSLASCGTMVDMADLKTAFEKLQCLRSEKYKFQTSSMDFQLALKELDGNFIRTAKYGHTRVVTFHNPSISDFISAYLKENIPEVADVLNAGIFYEQFTRMSQFLIDPHDKPETTRRLKLVEAELYSLFCRTISTPPILLHHFHSEGVYKSPLDQPQRIGNALEALSLSGSEQLRNKIQEVCELYFGNIQESQEDVSKFAPLLDKIDKLNPFGLKLQKRWKEASLPRILVEPDSLEDAKIAAIWIGKNGNLVLKEDLENYIETVSTFLMREVKYLVDDEDDEDNLSGILGDLEEIEAALGIDLDSEKSDVSARIEEIQSEREDDEDMKWSGSGKASELREEMSEIVSIFESLKK